ncbi:MAG: hypothetical protein KatS3mg103_0332 [Phycisphaerales bacterium]|nr:MAG: hypothetical protein KatS3mg103_0332 [Phycisphaerales bacterium]
MFTFEQYTDVVPLWALALAPILGGLVFMLCPARLRLPAALIALPPFLLVGGLPLLGAVALGAKALGFAMLLAVAAAAVMAPGPKRRLSPLSYVYVPLALAGPVFIATTEENLFPMLRSVQWICMVLAVLAVARTIVDAQALLRVLRLLAIGFIIDTPILLSALLSGHWTFSGHSRFEPYGASSLQVGMVYTITVGLALYFAVRDRNVLWKVIWIGTVAASAGMALLSGSRSVVITMMGVCAPIGVWMLRKPILAVPMVGILLVGIVVVISQVDSNPFKRYQTLETTRWQQAAEYIQESIAQRPLTGLLGTQGMKADVDEELGYHAHNAYLKMAYTGGLVLAVPYLFLAAMSMYSAAQVWRNRWLLDVDPLLISTLAAFMFMVYAQGLVNHMIYLGTTMWGFMHLLLSTMFLTWAGEIARFRRANPALATMLAQRRAVAPA